MNGETMESLSFPSAVEFYKYRRKSTLPHLGLVLCFLSAAYLTLADENYKCNNLTQTCKGDFSHVELGDPGISGLGQVPTSTTEVPRCRGKVLLNHSAGFLTDGPGNYSLDYKCTWVLQSTLPNATITLQLLEFATECSWDHLYIYDGSSVFGPVLAVYSGLTAVGHYKTREFNAVTSSTNSMLLYFYSDLAYNMSGFNISYSVNSCPINEKGLSCFNHGVCVDNTCTCDAGYYGKSCQFSVCPQNCSGNGICNMESHSCICNEGWSGLDCSQIKDRGFWTKVWNADNREDLFIGRTQSSGSVWKGVLWVVGGHGFDLNMPLLLAFNISANSWSQIETNGIYKPSLRHGHSTVIHQGALFMFGGIVSNGTVSAELWSLNLTSRNWIPVQISKYRECYYKMCGPVAATGHSAVLVKDKMYIIFGYNNIYGYLNTVQEFNIENQQWNIVTSAGALVQGSYGHSSVWDPLTKRIYVYGGYQSESSLAYGPTDSLYSFDPSQKSWRVHSSSGSYRYLHSAVMSGGLMLVFGGNTNNETATSNGAKCYSADFVAYDALCDVWYKMPEPSPSSIGGDLPRYGHLAASFGPSSDLNLEDDYQHSFLPYGMLIFGGFDGRLKSDVLVYVVGSCTSLVTKENCIIAMPGVKCVWNKAAKKCEPLTSPSKEGYEKCGGMFLDYSATSNNEGDTHLSLPVNFLNNTSFCSSITSCTSCLHTTMNCVWCGRNCQYARCKDGVASTKAVTSSEQCQVTDANSCRLLHSCSACHIEPHCQWESDARCYPYGRKMVNRTEKATDTKVEQVCDLPCSMRNSCRNCTQGNCLWCSNQNRCIDKKAYIPSFPYGLCTEWTTHDSKCRDPDIPIFEEDAIGERNLPMGASVYMKMTICKSYKNCSECQEDPACGWCDDGSNSGIGSCMPGSAGGPLEIIHNVKTEWTCPAQRWFFTVCPLCQCNGHSTCSNESHVCKQPCQHLTEGMHCETCISGFYGSPINGGTCSPCQCNGHGLLCNRSTGRCFCTTKGVAGDYCERCDVANHYAPELLPMSAHSYSNNSTDIPTNWTLLQTCYYDLHLDFQFTFNLSRKDDRLIKQINFRNVPTKPDLDLEFSVQCSTFAKLNISVRSIKANGEFNDSFIMADRNCTSFKSRFQRNEYNFGGEENKTFFVYVYEFQSPIQITVSFSQHPKLELQQFFITFSACFISLLMMAAILWKIKQKYDMYRRRQRLFVEMEQMASRPFSHVLVELYVPAAIPNCTADVQERLHASDASTMETSFNVTQLMPASYTPSTRKRRKFRPSPIALEPCADQKAAVLSLLIQLPSGTQAYTPPGQSGLAIASTLISLGSASSRKSHSNDSRDQSQRVVHKVKTSPPLAQMT